MNCLPNMQMSKLPWPLSVKTIKDGCFEGGNMVALCRYRHTVAIAICVFAQVYEYVFLVVCRHDTLPLYSQGHAIIIAASDSIMIQFYLLHRGQEVQWDIRNG